MYYTAEKTQSQEVKQKELENPTSSPTYNKPPKFYNLNGLAYKYRAKYDSVYTGKLVEKEINQSWLRPLYRNKTLYHKQLSIKGFLINLIHKNKHRVSTKEDTFSYSVSRQFHSGIQDLDVNSTDAKKFRLKSIPKGENPYDYPCENMNDFKVAGVIKSGEYSGKGILADVFCGKYDCPDCTLMGSIPHKKRYTEGLRYLFEMGLLNDASALGHYAFTVPDVPEIKEAMVRDYLEYFSGGNNKKNNYYTKIRKIIEKELGIDRFVTYVHPCGDVGNTFHPHFHMLFQIKANNENFDCITKVSSKGVSKGQHRVSNAIVKKHQPNGWLSEKKRKRINKQLIKYFHKRYKTIPGIKDKVKNVVCNYNFRLGYHAKSHALWYCSRLIHLKDELSWVNSWKYKQKMFLYTGIWKEEIKQKEEILRTDWAFSLGEIFDFISRYKKERKDKYGSGLEDFTERIADVQPTYDIDWSGFVRLSEYMVGKTIEKKLGKGLTLIVGIEKIGYEREENKFLIPVEELKKMNIFCEWNMKSN